MAQPNNVAFQGRFSDMKERYNDMSKKEKAMVIGGTVAGLAAIGTGIIVRKDIKTLLKTGNFKQFLKDAGKTLKNAANNVFNFIKHPIKSLKKMFGKEKEPITVFSNIPGLSNETKKAMNEGRVQIAKDIVKNFDDMLARNEAMHADRAAMYEGLKYKTVGSTREHFEGILKELESRLDDAIIEQAPAKIKFLKGKIAQIQERLSH